MVPLQWLPGGATPLKEKFVLQRAFRIVLLVGQINVRRGPTVESAMQWLKRPQLVCW